MHDTWILAKHDATATAAPLPSPTAKITIRSRTWRRRKRKKSNRMYFILYRYYKWNISLCNIEKWVLLLLLCSWWSSTPTLHFVWFFFLILLFCCFLVIAYWLSWNVPHAYCLVTLLQYITLRFVRQTTEQASAPSERIYWQNSNDDDEQIKIYTQWN